LKTIQECLAKLAAAVLLASLLGACTSIPKQNLDSYVSNFNTAKSTAQDIYLSTQVQVEKKLKEDDSIEGRQDLSKSARTFKARLLALEMVDQYNGALVKLASGSDAAGVKENLEGLSSNLKAFGSEQLSNLVKDVVPYFGVISQAIALIDNAIKAQHFAEAVAAAQKPMNEIIGILQQDADFLFEIHRAVLAEAAGLERDKLLDVYFNFKALADDLNADSDLAASITAFNATSARMNAAPARRPAALVHAPASANRDVNSGDRALIPTMLNQANALVDSYNGLTNRIRVQYELTEEYKKLLDACIGSFTNLNTAVLDGRRIATTAFAANVLSLRRAFIEVREAK